jgi:hypothetical protein
MLDIIEPFLKKDGHRFVRCTHAARFFLTPSELTLTPCFLLVATDDGSMVDAKRQVSLEKIKNDPNTKVILISFKAGSTGQSPSLLSPP